MRMTASWFRSPRINRIPGRGAISAPDGELPSDLSPAAPRAGQFDHQQSLPVRPGTAKKGRGSERGDGCQLGQTRRLDKHRPIQGFRMPAITTPRGALGPASGSLQGRNLRNSWAPRVVRSSMGIWALWIGDWIGVDASTPAEWRHRWAGAGHHRHGRVGATVTIDAPFAGYTPHSAECPGGWRRTNDGDEQQGGGVVGPSVS